MEPFEAPIVAYKLERKPFEQFRMARKPSVVAEVAGIRHQTTAEMMLPDSVGHDTRKERVRRTRNPLGERTPLFGIPSIGRQTKVG